MVPWIALNLWLASLLAGMLFILSGCSLVDATGRDLEVASRSLGDSVADLGEGVGATLRDAAQ